MGRGTGLRALAGDGPMSRRCVPLENARLRVFLTARQITRSGLAGAAPNAGRWRRELVEYGFTLENG